MAPSNAQTTTCQWLYLRVTVGLLNALFVLGVALVALLVTATASLKALKDNGEAHVAALGNAAAYRVAVFFKRPESQANALSRYATSEALTFPSEHKTASLPDAQRMAMDLPQGGTELDRQTAVVTESMLDFDLSLFGTAMWLADGTRSIVFPIPQVKNAVYLEKWWRDNVTDVLSHRETIMYDIITGLRINSSDPRYGVFMPTRENVTLTDASSTATFNTLAGLVHLGRDQPVKWSTPRFFHEVVSFRYVLCSRALYNHTTLLGFAISGVLLGHLGDELDVVRSSPDALALVIGAGDFVLGSSGSHETFNVTEYSGGAVGAGCATTDQTQSTVPSDRRLKSCMHHIINFGVDVVRRIAATHDGDLHSSDAHQFTVSSGGDKFFTRIQKVKNMSLQAVVVVIVPEKEILGNVQQTIVAASLITAACVVVAAAACFGLVWWLLWPLRGIAVRMGKAARLEEDPDPVAISPLAEIGDLQRAFVEMRDELDRIRSYVPQSLLRASDTTDDEEATDLDTGLTPNDTPTHGHRRSTARSSALDLRRNKSSEKEDVSRSTFPTTTDNSSNYQAAERYAHRHGVKIVDGMRHETVSILCLNVSSFHWFFSDGGKDKQQCIGQLVESVLAVAQSERGVVESFHGDHFLVSFNAVKPAANHGTRATVAAMQVAEAAESLGLAVTAGVATGTAQVGNMGTKGMMRFSIVGPVVAQASALERMCKLYSDTDSSRGMEMMEFGESNNAPGVLPLRVTCLVPQRLFQDLSTAMVTRTVDYVHLPQAKNPCLIAQVVKPLTGRADDEWVYQLSAYEQANPIATANAAWMAGLSQNLIKAQALFAVLDERVERSPNDVLCRRAADCPRLRAIVSSRPEPRLLGEFYEKTLQHPTS